MQTISSTPTILITALLCLSLVQSATYSTYTKTVSFGNQVKLSYEIFQEGGVSKVKFLVQKSAAGHVSFGIGSSMKDADVVVIERTSSAVTVKDCKLVGEVAPVCGESNEAWELTAADNFELTATSMKVEIKRTLGASGADGDKSMVEGDNVFIYSYSTSNSIAVHDSTGDKGTAKFNLATGAVAYSQARLLATAAMALASLLLLNL